MDFAIIDIREAWDLLGSITGDTIHDDIIGEIFNRFCLGKYEAYSCLLQIHMMLL